MKEPILSREQVLKIVRKTLKENNDRDKLSSDRFVALASAFEEALLEKLCGEPVAWECSSPVGEKPSLAFLTSKSDTLEHYRNQGWRVLPLYTIKDSQS